MQHSSNTGAKDQDLERVAEEIFLGPNEIGQGSHCDAQETAGSGTAQFSFKGLLSAVQFKYLSRKRGLDRAFVVRVTKEGTIDAEPDVSPEMAELVRGFTPSVFRDEVPAGFPPDRGIDHLVTFSQVLSHCLGRYID